jgi:membrane protease YdiL (CAAX protease family)
MDRSATQGAFLQRHSLAMGIVLMFALTWPFYAALGLFVGYGLALAALIVTSLTLGREGVGELLRRFLIWRVGVQWYLVILLGPAILALAAIGLNAVLTGASPNFDNVYARQIFGTSSHLGYLVVPFFLVDALANGEELGWRGFVLPRLQARHSALVSSLILGFVWGLWHLPKFWAAGEPESLALAIVHNMALAILFTWVYNNTQGSLLIATLFHAAMNTAHVFLPVAASASDDLTRSLISIGIELVAALVVALAAGPVQLSRPGPVEAQAVS